MILYHENRTLAQFRDSSLTASDSTNKSSCELSYSCTRHTHRLSDPTSHTGAHRTVSAISKFWLFGLLADCRAGFPRQGEGLITSLPHGLHPSCAHLCSGSGILDLLSGSMRSPRREPTRIASRCPCELPSSRSLHRVHVVMLAQSLGARCPRAALCKSPPFGGI